MGRKLKKIKVGDVINYKHNLGIRDSIDVMYRVVSHTGELHIAANVIGGDKLRNRTIGQRGMFSNTEIIQSRYSVLVVGKDNNFLKNFN